MKTVLEVGVAILIVYLLVTYKNNQTVVLTPTPPSPQPTVGPMVEGQPQESLYGTSIEPGGTASTTTGGCSACSKASASAPVVVESTLEPVSPAVKINQNPVGVIVAPRVGTGSTIRPILGVRNPAYEIN